MAKYEVDRLTFPFADSMINRIGFVCRPEAGRHIY